MQGFLFCLEIVQKLNKESDKFEIVVFKNQNQKKNHEH